MFTKYIGKFVVKHIYTIHRSKGYYTQGAKLIVEAVDIIRCETEGCQCLQQFQLTISIGGGIGLFGDSTTYQGIPERVQKELKALAPDCINALKDWGSFETFGDNIFYNIEYERLQRCQEIYCCISDVY